MMGPGPVASPYGMSLSHSMEWMGVVSVFVAPIIYGIPFALLCLPWVLGRRSEEDFGALAGGLMAARLNLAVGAVVCLFTTIIASSADVPPVRGIALACPYVLAASLIASLVFWRALHPRGSDFLGGHQVQSRQDPRVRARTVALFSLAVWSLPLIFSLASTL